MSLRATAAAGDVAEGLRRWRSWTYLAVEAVKNQYRRTVIGPWWLTLQTSAYVVGLAVLFGAIFHQPLDEFVPYVAAGFIGYTLLAGLTGQGRRGLRQQRGHPAEHPPAAVDARVPDGVRGAAAVRRTTC